MQQTPAIEIKGLSFSYGTKRVLESFELSVNPGKIYCFIGSSGSGKTTALRLMNGLLKPQAGEVVLNGKPLDFSKAEEARRVMGYSIQGSGLFPHMTLYENLTIIARKEGWKKDKIKKRVGELLELMSLPNTKAFLNKKPRQISGGQQQRVGIARALFMKPQIMLMDEPFSALDPITRSELQKEFIRLQQKLKITIVIVTHDLSEAFSMADEIILLNEGRIEQKGRPSKFLLSPASPYVDEFIHSHSPGSILKEVYLYSVVNSSIWVSENKGEKIRVLHLEKEVEKLLSPGEHDDFIKSAEQSAIYWVDSQNHLKKYEDLAGQSFEVSLRSTENILFAMKALLQSKTSALPVVSQENKIVGVFSQEALGAL